MNIKVFTAFSGYDSQCLALNRLRDTHLDFGYELVGWSEIDKYAIQAHNALFPTLADRNYGDISKIDWSQVPDFDLFTYSSPCQDFSIAGLQRGGEEGSGTRSSLLWECEKAISIKKPKYLLFENVKALTSKKFIKLFEAWQERLVGYGYTNYWQVLNAKNYGVPQNRERVFMVSILNDDQGYEFPKPFPLTIRLRDILEGVVDEKYYLSDQAIKGLKVHNEHHNEKGTGFVWRPRDVDGCASTLRANGAFCPTDNSVVVKVGDLDQKFQMDGRVYSPDGVSPTLRTSCGGGHEPKILTAKRNEFGKSVRKAYESHEEYHKMSELRDYVPREDGISNTLTTIQKDNYLIEPKSKGCSCSRVEGMIEQGKIPDEVCYIDAYNQQVHTDCTACLRSGNRGLDWVKVPQEIDLQGLVFEENGKLYIKQNTKEGKTEIPEGSVFDPSYPTSKTRRGRVQEGGKLSPTLTTSDNLMVAEENYRIRKLTETEYFRLMGLADEDIVKIQASGVSKTQQYKMAGNSIVVDVLFYIFCNLFYGEKKSVVKQLAMDFEEEEEEPQHKVLLPPPISKRLMLKLVSTLTNS